MSTFTPTYTKPVFPLKQYPSDKVICIMPCYNNQDTIRGAIKSIIDQSHTNWELIIVDDASTDNSVKIITEYLSDSRITLLKNKTNQGCYYSRNRGLFHVKDKEWSFFTIHDSDDESHHDRFLIYINTFYSELVECLLGIYNGKRWYNHNNKSTLKYEAAKSSVGTAWYTKDTFNTLGYFYPSRFGSDSEYKEKLLKLAVVIEKYGKGAPPEQVIKFINKEYAYTYTTKHSDISPSLTKKHSVEDRKEFERKYNDRHASFTNIKQFYQDFTPNKEDL